MRLSVWKAQAGMWKEQQEEEEEGAQDSCFANGENPWEDLEMTVVSLNVQWGGKGTSGIRKVKTKQKALSATLELTESTQCWEQFRLPRVGHAPWLSGSPTQNTGCRYERLGQGC